MQFSSINSINTLQNFACNKNSVSFTAKAKPEQVRAMFYPETIERVDRLYKGYKDSLHEVSFSDIKSKSLEIAQEMQIPKKDVLKAMQLLTQFSNMRGFKTISDAISKERVIYMDDFGEGLYFEAMRKGLSPTNARLFAKATGLNNSLLYVTDKKKLAPITYNKEKRNFGLIIDEEKLASLEQVQKSEPEEFAKFVKDKHLKFFYISGWDTGIPVVDRTRDLAKKTKELIQTAKEKNISLEEAVDASLMERIKALGIKPIVIRNENPSTELGVYNQMKPAQVNKTQILNLIEANTVARCEKLENVSDFKRAEMNEVSAKYFEDTLCVYTPEKMSEDLKTIHQMIDDYAKSQGKQIIYLKKDATIKSTDYINYSYQKINGVDPSRFTSISNFNYFVSENPNMEISPENTLLVMLDDCSLSGNSISSIRNYYFPLGRVDNKYSILYANLKGTEQAEGRLKKKSSRNRFELMIFDKIKSENLSKNKVLAQAVGKPAFSDSAPNIIFPYMTPDNCPELVSNFSLLHNYTYQSQPFSSEVFRTYVDPDNIHKLPLKEKARVMVGNYKKDKYLYTGSKTITHGVRRTSVRYTNMIGQQPIIVEKGSLPEDVDSFKNKSIWSKLRSLFN